VIALVLLVDEPGSCEDCGRRFEAMSYKITIGPVAVKVCDGCAVELREIMHEAG
jgi:ribosome-binding protein aMBF1 (putative translation factor)